MKKRIISAIVAILILAPLIYIGGILFTIGVCVIAALAYKEIIDLRKSQKEFPLLIIFLGFFCMIAHILSNNTVASIYEGITY